MAAERVGGTVREFFRRSAYKIGSWFGWLLVVGAIAYTTWRIGVESERPVTSAEEAIGELIALIGGIAGSFLAARSTFRGHARSAFRRLLSMYDGLGEIAKTAVCETPEEHESALARIGAIASVHYGTAWDALEDWSDIAPQQVSALKEDLSRRDRVSRAWSDDVGPPPLSRGAVSTDEGSER